MPKLANTSLLFILYCNRKLCANGNSPFLNLSETFRSMKIFILAFLKRSEAWKSSFWPFWNVQRREKLHFGLSEMFRSMKNFFLAFLKCSEAWKTFFGLSETFRSMKIFILVFLKCSEAWKTSIWCFWNVQKHEKPLFGVSETFRSMFFSYFCLSAPRLST